MRGLTRTRPAEPPAPARRRFSHPGWTIASAVLIACIVAAGVWVAIAGDGGQDAPSADRPPAGVDAAPSTPGGPVEAPRDAACPDGLDAEEQALPQAPPVAEWRPVGRVDAPFAVEHGPVFNDAGVFRCFARTPTGALFAAANFLAAVTDAGRLERAVTDLTAPGPGQDRLAELAATDPVAITGSGSPYEVAGFTFLSATLETVAVSVVVRVEGGGMAAVPVTLVWDDDWRIQLPDDGDLTRLASPVQTLTGFVPWQAE